MMSAPEVAPLVSSPMADRTTTTRDVGVGGQREASANKRASSFLEPPGGGKGGSQAGPALSHSGRNITSQPPPSPPLPLPPAMAALSRQRPRKPSHGFKTDLLPRNSYLHLTSTRAQNPTMSSWFLSLTHTRAHAREERAPYQSRRRERPPWRLCLWSDDLN